MEIPKTKKWWMPIRESDLTEEEVRIWFWRLQVLQYVNIKHIQWLKEQRKQLNIEKQEMIKTIADLNKKIKRLEKEIEKINKKNTYWYKQSTKDEIKKRFLDSL